MNTKKALFIDLDNTIYPAASIGNDLFKDLFSLIAEDEDHLADLENIKKSILRKPFHHVAKEFNMSESLYEKSINHLVELEYEGKIPFFEDYVHLKKLPQTKFLITAGFTKLQTSKIKQLNLQEDFEAFYIMDFTKTDETKIHAFQKIIKEYNFKASEILIIGDDPDSEIKAGKELGIDCVLYDSLNLFEHKTDLIRITNFSALAEFLS